MKNITNSKAYGRGTITSVLFLLVQVTACTGMQGYDSTNGIVRGGWMRRAVRQGEEKATGQPTRLSIDTMVRSTIMTASIGGERPVSDAAAMAEDMAAEAESLWASSNNWKVHKETSTMKVESRPVDAGPYAKSGMLVMRATGIVPNASAGEVLARLTSEEGFAAISPIADTSHPPLEVYPWEYPHADKNPVDLEISTESQSAENKVARLVGRGGGRRARILRRLEARLTKIPMPAFMSDREFVVLNAVDPYRNLFMSKSILHPSQPGSSSYIDGIGKSGGRIRGVTAFFIKTEPIENGDTEKVCRIHYLSFVDLGGNMPKSMVNAINARASLQDVHKRVLNLFHTK